MAKISAHGCYKVASARKVVETGDSLGGRVRIVFALRSDGSLLERFDHWNGYGRERFDAGHYSVKGTLKPTVERSSLERFHRFCEQRGYVVDAGANVCPQRLERLPAPAQLAL